MSRILVTGGPAVVGHGLFLLLLAAGRAVRTIVGNSMQAALVGATADTGGDQPPARLSLALAGDYDTERLDGAAGCEFVDDRLRQVE